MKKTTSDILMLAGIGASLILNANDYTVANLIQIAGSVNLHDGHLTILYAQNKTTSDLLQIASSCPNKITFDFNEY